MKKYHKGFKNLRVFLLSIIILSTISPTHHMAQGKMATITVDDTRITPLVGAKKVGTNIEMSMTSDEMWDANGQWMSETFKSTEINMMRWGYDAWAFDWEKEVPLSPKYWGGLNTPDAAGTFGLREFIDFCKENDIVPFVMIPIESLERLNGGVPLEKVKELTISMSQYIASQGIDLCYFDMGNEPWNNGGGGLGDAKYIGGLFEEFESIVKSANNNFKLVLQRAPENILWNTWNNTLISATKGHFDAYDDHRYSFYGWNKYFDFNSDDMLISGKPIAGKEAILGECNIGWTPTNSDWDAGHVRDQGGGMALLNAMLNIIDKGTYSYIVTWPSHYPSRATVHGSPKTSFGWFDLDDWHSDKATTRLTGPILAHQVINDNVLDNKVYSTSTDNKVRTFAYTNNDETQLNIIIINKWEATTLTLEVPSQYGNVSAMSVSGTSVYDTTPEYSHLFKGIESVTQGNYVSTIPAESVITYTFTTDQNQGTPGETRLSEPINLEENVSTAKAFTWNPVQDVQTYHLVVSKNDDLSNPEIDVYTGKKISYQASIDLDRNTTYYWGVRAVNETGVSAMSNLRSFTTNGNTSATSDIVVLNNDSQYISHSSGWVTQQSRQSYRNDDMATNKYGEYAEFTFYGTRAKIYGIKGDWCGLADVQVNFSTPTAIDMYSPTTQEQALFFDTGDLPLGEHTVKLTVKGDKNSDSYGKWIEYDKVELFDDVNGVAQVDKVVWNVDNPNIKKSSGKWNQQYMYGAYHDNNSSSKTRGANMTFSFNGSNSKIYGLKAPWCGNVEIIVDGISQGVIDTYSPTDQPQAVLYDTGTLKQESHTIEIRVHGNRGAESSGNWVEIDRVEWK